MRNSIVQIVLRQNALITFQTRLICELVTAIKAIYDSAKIEKEKLYDCQSIKKLPGRDLDYSMKYKAHATYSGYHQHMLDNQRGNWSLRDFAVNLPSN